MRADTKWMRRGACRGLPPEVFFPPERDLRPALPWSAEAAQAVCARCPVAEVCGDWAVATRQKDGVWGGMTEAELHRRQRQPRRRAS